jgi:hypothetical protein
MLTVMLMIFFSQSSVGMQLDDVLGLVSALNRLTRQATFSTDLTSGISHVFSENDRQV